VLKEDKQWDAWYQSTLAQAHAQDVAEVLEKLYLSQQFR